MPKDGNRNLPFDVDYGLASASITAGLNIVATTEAAYHGIAIVAGTTANAKIIVYDNASATSGNIVDTFLVGAGDNKWIDRYIPVKARNGLVVSATGVGVEGTVFFGPKG